MQLVLAILDAIRNSKNIRFYQAGTSEMFGKTKDKLQNEKTKFNPQSAYGTAKLFAHHITRTIETHITFLHVMGSF